MTIPDLRRDSDIELDHMSVLLEKLGKVLAEAYDGEDPAEMAKLCDMVDPVSMRQDMSQIFTKNAFFGLYGSEFGRGVLVGAFFQKFVLDAEDSE